MQLTQTNQNSYSMPYSIMFSSKMPPFLRRIAVFHMGTSWASNYEWEEVAACVCITCFILSSLFSSSLPMLFELFLSQPMIFLGFTLPFLLPWRPGWVRLSEQL